MNAMELEIQTSTPIVCDKLIPPPPRKLWATDSPTEQLYRNKWTKYRNSFEEKESWNDLEAPRFIDFVNIPDARDSYFDNAEAEKFTTPQRTLAKRLPGLDSDNNNVLDSLSKCTLSAIKKCDEPINGTSGSFDKSSDTTIKTNCQDRMNIEVPKPPDGEEFTKIIKEEPSSFTKVEKKNRSDGSGSCTIVEPFSFEIREKFKQEHRQARRDRDSMGKEIWKGFRANPVPKFLKVREKNRLPGTSSCPEKKKISGIEMHKLNNATEIWKKKAFEPSRPRRVPIVTKPPQLFTAARARERQRFEEQMREKERQRLAIQKMEEAERKKREAEEITKLRRELVHKAQPIRKYKIIVPRVEKRPLTEPTTPITCKRRRKL